MDMIIGDVILGHYEILDIIAIGGQACIGKGKNQQTGDFVTIKQLSISPTEKHYDQELARFQRAAGAIFHHPNVVDPIDSGEENGHWYLVFPYIEGLDLEKYVSAHGGKLPTNQAISFVQEIAAGLTAIHQNGYVHRDLKPGNIIIQPDDHVKIIDMGICRNANEKTITRGDGLLGSLSYMAPEQITSTGSEDNRTDLYSLGAVFYFMLTGSPPVQGNDSISIALYTCQRTPPSLTQVVPDLPTHIGQAGMQLLVKQREARFQTAQEFVKAIQGVPPTSAKSKYCTGCGYQNQTDSKFCTNCGASVLLGSDQQELCLACGTSIGQVLVCPDCNRPFSHCDHRLTFNTGVLRGHTFRIPEGIYFVGRDELASRDCHLSRQHFYMACSNGTVHIQDAGSTNKTFVDGHLADHPIPLQSQQVLQIAGNTAIYNHI